MCKDAATNALGHHRTHIWLRIQDVVGPCTVSMIHTGVGADYSNHVPCLAGENEAGLVQKLGLTS